MKKSALLCAVAMVAISGTAYGQTSPTAPASVGGDAPAQATASAPPQAEDTADIVVTGFRQSLTNAANLKRNSSQIQDSIVAEDVGKLPDTNIAETLQRIPGVQLTRNARGEGNGFSIHGLSGSNNQTLLNGRGIFQTANRVGALLDLSADILSGVDVYKTATADQIEGGLGGLVNIKTAHPFDQPEGSTYVSAAGNYSVIRNRVLPRLGASTSHRWDTGIGEMGFLLGATYEQVWTGVYDINTNAYSNRVNLYDRNGNGVFGADAGDAILVPGQVQARYTLGERTRASANAAFQWQANDSLLLTVDSLYFYSNGRTATRGLAAQLGSTTSVAAPFTFQGNTNVPSSATFNNVPLVSSSAAATNPYDTVQVGFNAQWKKDNWTITPDFAYTYSGGLFYSHSSNFTATAPQATIGLAGGTPDLAIGGMDLFNPANYTYANFQDLKSLSQGWEKAAKIDVRRDFDTAGIKSILVGVRYTDHDSQVDQYLNTTYSAAAYPLKQSNASVLAATPASLFGSTSSWLGTATQYTRDLAAARSLVGLSTGDPVYNPLNGFKVNEKTFAAYGEAQVEGMLGALPVDGNIGVRFLNTISSPTSYQSVNGAVTPVTARSEYSNFLPSVNVRFKFTPDFFLRLAASKALSRPNYADLNPVLGLNTSQGIGSAGNPNLQPVRSDSADASLEYYFGRSNLVAFSVFRKNVTGFFQTFGLPETINGVVYQISRPRNGGSGRLQGFEVNYQQFFDFLPGLLSGLGVQANFVYVDNAINTAGVAGVPAGQFVSRPAQLISKTAFNVTGIYEKGPLSLRLAYNRRSRYVDVTSADSVGNILWVSPLQSLDFSSTIALTDRIGLKFDAVNLTNTRRYEYYGTQVQPQIANQFDRSFEAGVRVKF